LIQAINGGWWPWRRRESVLYRVKIRGVDWFDFRI
jgi:hypothetical protein